MSERQAETPVASVYSVMDAALSFMGMTSAVNEETVQNECVELDRNHRFRASSPSMETYARSSSTPPVQEQRTAMGHDRAPKLQESRARSAVPAARLKHAEDGYPPKGWHIHLGAPPEGFLTHPKDRGAKNLFKCIYTGNRIIGLLAEPASEVRVRGVVVTSPGAGGGPGPLDPEGGGGGGTYGGYNAYRRLATALPSGIAVLLLHYPDGYPGERGEGVPRTTDQMEMLIRWYLARVQKVELPVALIGWSMGGAVVIEVAARMLHAESANVCGVATIASQTGQIQCTSLPLIVKSGAQLLLMAGSADTCLDPKCTKTLANKAGVKPVIFAGENHGVESAFGRLCDWLPATLDKRYRSIQMSRSPDRNSTRSSTSPIGQHPLEASSAAQAQAKTARRRTPPRAHSRPKANGEHTSSVPSRRQGRENARSPSRLNEPSEIEVDCTEKSQLPHRQARRERQRTPPRAVEPHDVRDNAIRKKTPPPRERRATRQTTPPRQENRTKTSRELPATKQSHKVSAKWDSENKSPSIAVHDDGFLVQCDSDAKATWHAAFLETEPNLHSGLSSGRFDFIVERAGESLVELGIVTRNTARRAALHWPGLKNTSAWTYASSGDRFWNTPEMETDETMWCKPFGNGYGDGDTVSLLVQNGSLRVFCNGVSQGVVFDKLPPGSLYVGATLGRGASLRLLDARII